MILGTSIGLFIYRPLIFVTWLPITVTDGCSKLPEMIHSY